MSGLPFELKVRTFGGVEVSRKSATTYGDGRPLFHMPPEATPLECVDTLPGGSVVKGHARTAVHEDLLSDCAHCGRKKGRYVIPGQEVRAWLQEMPPACTSWWLEVGCDGSGFITVGGDAVQGYCIDCKGCLKCKAPAEPPKG